jgi:hypothetical protein
LLSAAAPITLPSTYDGTLHAGGPKATAGDHTFALTLTSQSADGLLSGAMTVTGIGAYLFTGTLTRNTMTVYFHDSGASAGRFVGRVNSDGSQIVGRWLDLTGTEHINGSVHATPGNTAASAPGVPTTVGVTSSSTTLQQKNLIASYSGRAHVTGPSAFQLSISPYTITLNLTNETNTGLVTGKMGLLNTTLNFTGLVTGSQLNFVLTGPAAGEGSASMNSTGGRLTGSLVARFAAGQVRGAFVLFNPSAPKAGAGNGGSTSTAFNGSGLPGQPGSPTPVSTLPTGGTTGGTGTTGLGGTGFIPPTTTPTPGTGPITV